MKKKKVGRTITAVLFALALAVSPVGAQRADAASTAKPAGPKAPAPEDYQGVDYSDNGLNTHDHTGWTAITDVSQLRSLKSGKYYFDFPGGEADFAGKYGEISGDVTLCFNGNVLHGDGGISCKLEITKESNLTVCDCGYQTSVHSYEPGKFKRWEYNPSGSIQIQGGGLSGVRLTPSGGSTLEVNGGSFIGGYTAIECGGGAATVKVHAGNFMGAGSPIYISDPVDVLVENAHFRFNCKSSIALYAKAKAQIRDCEFRYNAGIGVNSADATTLIEDCVFQDNTSHAVLSEIATTTIQNCDISRNARALQIENCEKGKTPGTVILKDVTITENERGIDGGNAALLMSDCQVLKNGSGIAVEGVIDIDGCEVKDCGSGISGKWSATKTVKNTVVENIDGVGITLGVGSATGEFSVSGCKVANCSGNGIVLSGTTNTIKDCVVSDNQEKGIDASHGEVVIEGCTVQNNKNGIVSTSAKSIAVIGCDITDNHSTYGYAGGLELDSDSVLVKDCNILRNSSEEGAGGIRITQASASGYSDAVIEGCKINHNMSQSGGGGLQAGGTGVTLKILDSEICGNTAERNNYDAVGAGLCLNYVDMVEMAGVTVQGNTLKSSSCPTRGAGIYLGKDTILYMDGTKKPCVVTGNTIENAAGKEAEGAGIYHLGNNNQLHMAGRIEVTGNQIGERDSNVYLNKTCIYVDAKEDENAAISSGSQIGVSTPEDASVTCDGKKYAKVTMGENKEYQQCFRSDNGLEVKQRAEGAGTRVIMERNHVWGDTCVSNGDGTHSGSCEKCGEKDLTEDCHGGEANCTDKAICADCGGEYGEIDPDNHDWGEWEETEDGLKRVCKRNKEHIEEKQGETPKLYSVTARVETSRTGSVTVLVGDEPGTEAKKGDTITLEIQPAFGYEFVEWKVEKGDVTIGEDNTFVMPAEDVSLVAVFEPKTRMLTTLPETPGTGTVTAQVDGKEATKVCVGNRVALTAQPAEGYHFKEWKVIKGDVEILEDDTLYMPDADVEVRAVFEPDSYTVKAYAETLRSGTVGIYVNGEQGSQAIAGDRVMLTATPRDGYQLEKWVVKKGDITIDEDGCFTMPGEDVEVMAVFGPKTYTITACPEVAGTGVVESYVDGKAAKQAKTGEFVTLKATPAEGYRFVKWNFVSGDISVSDDGVFIMPPFDAEVHAVFEPVEPGLHKITLEVVGDGKASVSKTQAKEGEEISLKITPVTYPTVYTVKALDADGREIDIQEDAFRMPDSDVTVRVEFIKQPAGQENILLVLPGNDPNTNVSNFRERRKLEKILAMLQTAPDGATVSYDMEGKVMLPYTFLLYLKGRDINLELKMGDGISWTINGKTVKDTPLKGVNMGVSMNTNEIPAEVLSQDAAAMQISLAHEGDFGFTAQLSIDVPISDGRTASLFYYNAGGQKLEAAGNSIVRGGRASFSFTHASQYLITAGRANAGLGDADPGYVSVTR